MIKRRRTAVLGAFAVVASVFLLPASPAKAVTFDNACVNSLIPTQASLIPITMTADAVAEPGADRRHGHPEQHPAVGGHSAGGLRRRLQRRRPDHRG